LLLSYLAAGFKGAGIWTWNYRAAGWEGGEYALLDRNLQPSARAIRTGQIAQAAERFRDELWQAHKEPYVGVLTNWDSDAIWAAMSLRGRDHFKDYPMQARVGASRALTNGNVPWEYVTVRDLERGLGPRYKVIYLPGQIALSKELIALLTAYAQQGGRVVMDSPGGAYDEHGKVLRTAAGSPFEQLFGAELADLQYANNVVYSLEGRKLAGFVSELRPTTATVALRFGSGEPAASENRVGKGSALLLGWDASFSVFQPGNDAGEALLRRQALGTLAAPYRCDSAIVYRLASPAADHYFFINDGEAQKARLDTEAYRYRAVSDAVTGERLVLNQPVTLERYSGRWLRFEK
jgi:beta-galactosidase